MTQHHDLDPAFAAASYSRDLSLRVTPVPELSEPIHALPNALREIPNGNALARSRGWVRGALMGAALGLVVVMARAARSRPRRRSARARVVGELAREVGTRMLVSAASVVAARIASDVIAPRITNRIQQHLDR